MRRPTPSAIVNALLNVGQTTLERCGVYAELRSRLPRGIDWLLDVERILQPAPPRLILDVGANVGQTTTNIKRRFPGAEVHAFEPVRSTFETLRATLAQVPGVQCHNLALSNTEGSRTIPTVPGSVFNSLESPLFHRNLEAIPESVSLTTLDRFAAEHGMRTIDLLKTDTEGHDFEVLLGATSILARRQVRCIYTEVTFSQANRQNSLFGPIFDFLQSMGYRFMGLYEMDFFQINPWDATFCNALFSITEDF